MCRYFLKGVFMITGKMLKKMMIMGGIVLACVGRIQADERQFAYSYQADSVLPQDRVEYEQWATLRSGKDTGKYARWDLRQEIEYGFTDTFTAALYINSSNTYSDGVTGIDNINASRFDGVSVELKQMLQSPYKNPIGALVYFETRMSGSQLELEEKLVLEHIHDEKWDFVTNIVVAQEWNYYATSTEMETELQLTGGVSYRLTPKVSIGLEGYTKTTYSDFFGAANTTAVFLGPNIHYGSGNFQLTAAVLKQLTNVYDGFESIESRVIAGIYF